MAYGKETILIVALVAAGCSKDKPAMPTAVPVRSAPSTTPPPKAPAISESEARAIVDRYNKEQGFDPRGWDAPRVMYSESERAWKYMFQANPAYPGGHFTVVVDEAGTASVIPGR